MLHTFLSENRDKILARVREMTAAISDDRPTSANAERGMPRFYDHLIHELLRESKGLPKRSIRHQASGSTAQHGKELSKLGYTVSQVVHGYGALCQAITEVATNSGAAISSAEFSTLNLSLDVAIADAVTAFAEHADVESAESTQRIGSLVHELRNALAAAIIAQSLLKKGVVGPAGSTNVVLERNLNRMRDILDRSFSEVRMQNDKAADLRPVRLVEVLEEVEATAAEEARTKGLSLTVQVDAEIVLDTDRHYLISALANLIQNAIKYSLRGGVIQVRGREKDGKVLIEVEDRCGGLPKGKAEELFQPFVQKSANKTGLGLGLTITRHAVELNGGALEVRDLPGKGCVFTVTLPKHARTAPRKDAKVLH